MDNNLIKKQHFSWKALGWALLYFWFFSTLLQVVIVATGYSGTNGLRDSLLYSLLWLIPIFIFPRYIRPIAAVIGIVLWATSLAALGYYVIYGQEFSQSVLFVMFESNTNEASEYLSQYFNVKMILVAIIYTVIALFLWNRLRPVYLPLFWRWLAPVGLLYALIINPIVSNTLIDGDPLSSTFNGLAARMEPAAPWQFVTSYYQYRQQLDEMDKLLSENHQLPPLNHFVDKSGDLPRTLVLVIGESTQRGRMSLYGYPRPTTPGFDTLHKTDPHFTVFNNVVTSRPYTIEILQQALTFADQQNPDLYLTKPSIMNMMKQAGYKTFWITNQQTMTERNTMLTVFSKQTDTQYYMNQQRTQSAREYDTNVLAPFQKVLTDPAPKKFIIVHLLGTHLKYKYRYPENAGIFDDDTEYMPAGLSRDKAAIYNQYDNAVHFNDSVVTQLIKYYKASKPNGFLLYFSDHGEEVYDTPPHDIQGRNEEAPTRHMYSIPFVLWTSPTWQAAHPRDFSTDMNRQYSSSQLIHTWSDLAGLSYDGYDATRSITSPQFVQTTRWIGDPYKEKSLKDYDALPYAEQIGNQ